jgi:hypothetical protein
MRRCSVVEIDGRSRYVYCLQHQGDGAPLKHRSVYTGPHVTASQKTLIFIPATIRNWNVAMILLIKWKHEVSWPAEWLSSSKSILYYFSFESREGCQTAVCYETPHGTTKNSLHLEQALLSDVHVITLGVSFSVNISRQTTLSLVPRYWLSIRVALWHVPFTRQGIYSCAVRGFSPVCKYLCFRSVRKSRLYRHFSVTTSLVIQRQWVTVCQAFAAALCLHSSIPSGRVI